MKTESRLLLIGMILLWGCSLLAQAPQRHFPAAEWTHDKCNTISGISSFVIDSMNTTGLLVVHAGKLVFSYGDVSEQSYIASCRKSILAMLYGNYVANGSIDLDASMASLGIDDRQGLSEVERQATVAHLLSSCSGVYHPSSYPGDDLAFAPARGSQSPGSYFLYNNWDFNAAGAIFEQQTGVDLYDALEKDLAVPLGLQDFDRQLQKKTGNLSVSQYPAFPIHLSTRDMARIGYLMLNKGKWNDQQLIPEWWVEKITSLVTPNAALNPAERRASEFGYGHLWWVYDQENLREELEGAYAAQGIYGQYITVIPKLDLVIAHKTNALFQRHTHNYERLVHLIIDQSQALVHASVSLPTEGWKAYVGTYSNDQLTMEVSLEAGQLYMDSPLGKLTLLACDKAHFSLEEEDRFRLRFHFGDGGEVESFELSPDSMKMGVFEKRRPAAE
ncbi:MAG: serine hydrolase [Bacteroidota bacterium]